MTGQAAEDVQKIIRETGFTRLPTNSQTLFHWELDRDANIDGHFSNVMFL